MLLAAIAGPGWGAVAKTARVSVSSAEVQGNSYSQAPAISAGGRFVAFPSTASNLVRGDTNGFGDVFVRDRKTGTTRRVSVRSEDRPGISADGRFVAFDSTSPNLVGGDENGVNDIFVRDLKTGTTRRMSLSSGEREANGPSQHPTISANGRFVAYGSSASNLVSGDANNADDIFIRDRRAGRTTRISVSSGGVEGNGHNFNPAISASGRFVAFQSLSNLVGNDGNNADDILVRDRRTGRTSRVSVSSAEAEANADSTRPAISAGGRFVAFVSNASNLVGGDENAVADVFVRDQRTGRTSRVSVSSAEVEGNNRSSSPAISADGRFVAFSSSASNLVRGDTNAVVDVFVRDRRTGRTRRVSVSSAGAQGNAGSFSPAISAGGQVVTFESTTSNLVARDTNGVDDIFVRGPLRWPAR